MITLLTGTTGAGKTAYFVNELVKVTNDGITRPLYIHGVVFLTTDIPHTTIYCKSELCEVCQKATKLDDAFYVENWHEWAAVGSLIFVDEVQRIFRPRSGSSKPPDAVAKLETHRHSGIDFWFATQHPNLVDISIRALVAKHIHITSAWNGRAIWEWSECKTSLSRNDAVRRDYKLPKKIFSLYKSAEVHTELKHKKPFFFYLFWVLAVFLLLGCFWFYNSISHKAETFKPPKTVQSVDSSSSTVTPPLSAATAAHKGGVTLEDFKPRYKDRLETAPAYDSILKIVDAPLPVACLYNKKTNVCKCYTSQATEYPASRSYCLSRINDGVFNPFKVVKN